MSTCIALNRGNLAPMKNATVYVARFWSKVDKNGPVPSHRPDLGPCWIWTAGKCNGYGHFYDGAKMRIAHRYSLELAGITAPDGYEPDHLCRVRACVRPSHLEMVTHAENIRRGLTGKVNHRNAVKTHCPHGHPYDESNTGPSRQPDGSVKRRCRTCHRIAEQRRGELRRSA